MGDVTGDRAADDGRPVVGEERGQLLRGLRLLGDGRGARERHGGDCVGPSFCPSLLFRGSELLLKLGVLVEPTEVK